MAILVICTLVMYGLAVLLIFFPDTARDLHVGWYKASGIKVDPDAPLLADDWLRTTGVVTLLVAMFFTAGAYWNFGSRQRLSPRAVENVIPGRFPSAEEAAAPASAPKSSGLGRE